MTQAFDTHAATYDDTFTHTVIGQHLRGRVHQRLLSHFGAGNHVLELGCGTGEDALYLADRGIHVTATDVSEVMLQITRDKTKGYSSVQVEHLDLAALSTSSDCPEFDGIYDGVVSNFGALNCLSDWRPLAEWLVQRTKVGSIVGLGIMSPFCFWEIAWHSLHLDFKTAFRRWRRTTRFGDTAVHYPTIRRMTRDFAPHFHHTYVEALGLFLPPSDVYGVIERRPRLLNTLTRLDTRFARHSSLALLADHYWIEFERKSYDI